MKIFNNQHPISTGNMPFLDKKSGNLESSSKNILATTTNVIHGKTNRLTQRTQSSLKPNTRLYSAVIKTLDFFEHALLHSLLKIPMFRAFITKRFGVTGQKLYRGLSANEFKEIRNNNGKYQADKYDFLRTKFVTPDIEYAKQYVGKGGALVEIEAPLAIAYYKLSRFWNRASRQSKEHFIIVNGKEKVSPVESSGKIKAKPTQKTAKTKTKQGTNCTFHSVLLPPDGKTQKELITIKELRPGFSGTGTVEDTPLRLDFVHDVIGVNVNLKWPFRDKPQISIGNHKIGTFKGAMQPGMIPKHGFLELSHFSSQAIESIEITRKVPSLANVTDVYTFDTKVHAGETFEIPLASHRHGQIFDQIDMLWHGKYQVPDPTGRLTSTGRPRYLDGVYATVYLIDNEGKKHRLSKAKFISRHEEDNLHGLGFYGLIPPRFHGMDFYGLIPKRGNKLVVEFSAKHPEGKNHPVFLKAVKVRYKRDREKTVKPEKYNINKTFQPGEGCRIQLPLKLRDRPIARIEVRWTDMLSGTWSKPGRAWGQLMINGKPVGKQESVQSPEVQNFDYCNGLLTKSGQIEIKIEKDPAEIKWIKVYFE